METITSSRSPLSRTFEYDEFCDCDFTGADVFGAALQETYDQFSQEFRLSSPVGESFDYILGLYYQTSEHEYADQITVSPTSVLIPAINAAERPLDLASTACCKHAGITPRGPSMLMLSVPSPNSIGTSVRSFTLQVGARITNDQRDGFRTLEIVSGDFSPLPPAQYGSAAGLCEPVRHFVDQPVPLISAQREPHLSDSAHLAYPVTQARRPWRPSG